MIVPAFFDWSVRRSSRRRAGPGARPGFRRCCSRLWSRDSRNAPWWCQALSPRPHDPASGLSHVLRAPCVKRRCREPKLLANGEEGLARRCIGAKKACTRGRQTDLPSARGERVRGRAAARLAGVLDRRLRRLDRSCRGRCGSRSGRHARDRRGLRSGSRKPAGQRRWLDAGDQPVPAVPPLLRYGDLAVLRATWYQAALVEGTALTMPEREALLRSRRGIAAYAAGIVAAIRAWDRAGEEARETASRPESSTNRKGEGEEVEFGLEFELEFEVEFDS